MYDYIIITLDSSFYKVNLYNEICKKKNIFVIFLCKKNKNRTEDFLNKQKDFDFIYLSEENYEERNKFVSCLKLLKLLKTLKYKKIILGGWDSPENWGAAFLSKKNKNNLVIESSEYESTTVGVKGFIKKLFLNRIDMCFCSGESQRNLVKKLGYKGKIKITKGVGIFEYKKINIEKTFFEEIKKFICVAGLIPVKNIEQIVRVFNEMPNLELTIVGKGPLEEKLKKASNNNIKYIGAIKNELLSEYYKKNDVFILPSKIEPWGLVVEEALYNGLPVILSNRVGSAKEVMKHNIHGLIYDSNSDYDLKIKIEKIIDLKNYKKYKKNVENIDFNKIREAQIESYLDME